MKRDKKHSIGMFSEKTGISVRTLHYYDEIGLLHPMKHPKSCHRIYNHQDLLILQKIVSLKFLGYSLNKIANELHEPSFTMDNNKTLNLHLQKLQNEKERIEQSITAVKRVIHLLEEEEEVDSSILFSLIHNMETENVQKEWMERNSLTEVMEGLSKKSEEEKIALDQTFIQLAKDVNQLYGKPVEDPKVLAMIKTYLEASFAFLGEDVMENLASINLEDVDIQELENMTPSPFSEEEEKWLNQAIEYYMSKTLNL